MPKPTDVSAPASNRARYRVLPLGHGRIFTGAYDAQANRFATFNRGDTGEADRAVAEALEQQGLVEIV
jgi:hypothetical protein